MRKYFCWLLGHNYGVRTPNKIIVSNEFYLTQDTCIHCQIVERYWLHESAFK